MFTKILVFNRVGAVVSEGARLSIITCYLHQEHFGALSSNFTRLPLCHCLPELV